MYGLTCVYVCICTWRLCVILPYNVLHTYLILPRMHLFFPMSTRPIIYRLYMSSHPVASDIFTISY